MENSQPLRADYEPLIKNLLSEIARHFRYKIETKNVHLWEPSSQFEEMVNSYNHEMGIQEDDMINIVKRFCMIMNLHPKGFDQEQVDTLMTTLVQNFPLHPGTYQENVIAHLNQPTCVLYQQTEISSFITNTIILKI